MSFQGLEVSSVDSSLWHLLASFVAKESNPSPSKNPPTALSSKDASSFILSDDSEGIHSTYAMSGIGPINPISKGRWPQPKKKNLGEERAKKLAEDKAKKKDKGKKPPKEDGKGTLIDTYASVQVSPLVILAGMIMMFLGAGMIGAGNLTPAAPGFMGTTYPNIDGQGPFMGGTPDMI
jgi:hypothetical protein